LTTHKVCRLCGNDSLRLSVLLERAPACISRLLRRDELAHDRPINLNLYECSRCGFLQSFLIPDSDVYENYSLSWMHLNAMYTYRQDLAHRYVQGYNLQQKTYWMLAVVPENSSNASRRMVQTRQALSHRKSWLGGGVNAAKKSHWISCGQVHLRKKKNSTGLPACRCWSM